MAVSPGSSPASPVSLRAAPSRVRATYEGHLIADSADVVMLDETGHAPTAYFPRADVEMAYMARTSRVTHCPHKGDASYYTLTMDGHIAENAVWSYEAPLPAMRAIAGRLAFYANVVDVREEAAPAPETTTPDQVVLHTDSGAGAPQAAPWAPTTKEPRGW